jgi:hypothetical protein
MNHHRGLSGPGRTVPNIKFKDRMTNAFASDGYQGMTEGNS